MGLSPGGNGYFTCIHYMKLVTNIFKSGGLHEKHVLATWNLGNHLSVWSLGPLLITLTSKIINPLNTELNPIFQ
jgi:hypothetical protein